MKDQIFADEFLFYSTFGIESFLDNYVLQFICDVFFSKIFYDLN